MRRPGVALVYGAAVAQGLVSVAFPASATMLRRSGLGHAQYGSLFLPQLTLAALGAVAASLVMHRLGTRRAFGLGYLLMASSQVFLVAACKIPAHVYPLALLGTSCLGLGNGISAGPLNAYPQALFPKRSEGSVLALHTATGAGLAITPVIAGTGAAMGLWILLPFTLMATHSLVARTIFHAELPSLELKQSEAQLPLERGTLWTFVGICVAYGMSESICGNWAVVFLTEDRGLGPAAAGAALTCFWAMLSLGRMAGIGIVRRVAPDRVLPIAAFLMASALLAVPTAAGAHSAAVVYGLAGAGCSMVLPLALGVACSRLPAHRSRVSAALFASLSTGLAIGSLSAGLLRDALSLATVYRVAAVPPLAAAGLALASRRAARRLAPAAPETPATAGT